MPFVSVTRLRLRSLRYLPGFAWHAVLSQRQAVAAKGCLSVRTRRTDGLAFWTLTEWEHRKDMARYRNSGRHAGAMPFLKEWCDEAATAHGHVDGPVDWDMARRMLVEEGRIYPVRHPSPAQAAGRMLGSSG